MSTSTKNDNRFDAIENLIFAEKLRIKRLDIHPELNIMNIILSTGFVFRTNPSSYASLKKATRSQILNYRLIGGGTGVHWPDIDEDLSLKGFLRDELLKVIKPASQIVS